FADLLFCFYGFFERSIVHLVVDDADHHVMSSFDETFHGRITHPAGDKPVEAGRGAAALDMAQYADPGVGIGNPFLDDISDVFCAPVAFGYDDEVDELAPAFFLEEGTDQLFDIGLAFGDEDILGAGGDP